MVCEKIRKRSTGKAFGILRCYFPHNVYNWRLELPVIIMILAKGEWSLQPNATTTMYKKGTCKLNGIKAKKRPNLEPP